MTDYVMGIDPGINGAIALYNPLTKDLIVHDIPTIQALRSSAAKDIDGYALAILIDSLKPKVSTCFIEKVGGVGKQSASRSFQFGLNTGIIHGIVYANLIPVAFVSPQKWKAHFGLKRPADASDSVFKTLSRGKASSLLPQHAHLWALAKHDGKAEATLIALYGGGTIND